MAMRPMLWTCLRTVRPTPSNGLPILHSKGDSQRVGKGIDSTVELHRLHELSIVSCRTDCRPLLNLNAFEFCRSRCRVISRDILSKDNRGVEIFGCLLYNADRDQDVTLSPGGNVEHDNHSGHFNNLWSRNTWGRSSE